APMCRWSLRQWPLLGHLLAVVAAGWWVHGERLATRAGQPGAEGHEMRSPARRTGRWQDGSKVGASGHLPPGGPRRSPDGPNHGKRASAVKMVHEGPACIMRRCRHGKPVHHAHQDSRVMLPDITVWPNRQSWQLPGHDPARLLGMGNRDRLTPAARSWPDA